jgi:hypothetical protein
VPEISIEESGVGVERIRYVAVTLEAAAKFVLPDWLAEITQFPGAFIVIVLPDKVQIEALLLVE